MISDRWWRLSISQEISFMKCYTFGETHLCWRESVQPCTTVFAVRMLTGRIVVILRTILVLHRKAMISGYSSVIWYTTTRNHTGFKKKCPKYETVYVHPMQSIQVSTFYKIEPHKCVAAKFQRFKANSILFTIACLFSGLSVYNRHLLWSIT